MKKITNILCIAGMGMMLFSACETDRDDNPTYHDASTFTLNEPENRVYDLGANRLRIYSRYHLHGTGRS